MNKRFSNHLVLRHKKGSYPISQNLLNSPHLKQSLFQEQLTVIYILNFKSTY